MASKSDSSKAAQIKEATRICRLAIADCERLLKRTEEMLRRSQQDNDPPYRN